MRRMPIPYRRTFPPDTMQRPGLWGIRPHFYGLSPCRGQVAYVLLTSAPVAGGGASTAPLPLDLHVLSLSLAFILSQDQTLRCWYLVFYFFSEIMFLNTRDAPTTACPYPWPSDDLSLRRYPKRESPHLSSCIVKESRRDFMSHLNLSISCTTCQITATFQRSSLS